MLFTLRLSKKQANQSHIIVYLTNFNYLMTYFKEVVSKNIINFNVF